MSPSTDASPNETLDGAVFQELLVSLTQPDAVATLYRKFIENAVEFIGELRNQDAAARAETLHTLKGSAGMMGATRMSMFAAELEARVASIQVEQTIQDLQGELEKFRRAAAGRLLALGASLDS